MANKRENLTELISEKEVLKRVGDIATQISNRYVDEAPILIGILNGSFIFAADLMRAIDIDCEIDFIKVSSYAGTASKGTVRLRKDISADITDRHVIIVEDIIDSGLTINFIRDRMHNAGTKSVAIATLLMKPDIAKLDFEIDWVGFEIPPEFVVGYGLDYDQKLRNLRGVYRLGEIESE
ncbi:MAG: hypoxanthine phosphoribosyltransferase [Candidatus Marinimicrobia bacterium]|jgi:hypoxanthine phosphoribosyltransferase|nr:hypoxanthine phosphoribosyltransferase [Candidatus Neomarinimicrobiota bacterium]MBT3676215.1 hypoxanthine phosphoribosyltransferase [Candidatus Neomarinimicrobiota bacterium]MBT3763098.1 hypoxanthine phosphoribosyltransferase [Candidatus Neomarinimicrobiota bacterium]MBT4067392.1 hypoxanthine phosphoribosyltransferase [Candidatus Neomarinimicrobiota bacterium]MBT4270875.1 hypoxanthine phosphoribosyltransferase [Candidatus Neomarinimicrobiota bacterium]